MGTILALVVNLVVVIHLIYTALYPYHNQIHKVLYGITKFFYCHWEDTKMIHETGAEIDLSEEFNYDSSDLRHREFGLGEIEMNPMTASGEMCTSFQSFIDSTHEKDTHPMLRSHSNASVCEVSC